MMRAKRLILGREPVVADHFFIRDTEVETSAIGRALRIARETGCRLYLCHLSTPESVELALRAKEAGQPVFIEVSPHHITLDEEKLRGQDGAYFKMNPSLRTSQQVERLRRHVCDGSVDTIGSDHAPHTPNEKEIEFERAEFGIIGLETELAVSLTHLLTQTLDLKTLVEKLTVRPAKILGINKGTLSEGADADIAIVAKDKEWVVKKEKFFSKSKNSPFIGKTLKGVVEYTILGGKIVYVNAKERPACGLNFGGIPLNS